MPGSQPEMLGMLLQGVKHVSKGFPLAGLIDGQAFGD